jgi:hypothetical protein
MLVQKDITSNFLANERLALRTHYTMPPLFVLFIGIIIVI